MELSELLSTGKRIIFFSVDGVRRFLEAEGEYWLMERDEPQQFIATVRQLSPPEQAEVETYLRSDEPEARQVRALRRDA